MFSKVNINLFLLYYKVYSMSILIWKNKKVPGLLTGNPHREDFYSSFSSSSFISSSIMVL